MNRAADCSRRNPLLSLRTCAGVMVLVAFVMVLAIVLVAAPPVLGQDKAKAEKVMVTYESPPHMVVINYEQWWIVTGLAVIIGLLVVNALLLLMIRSDLRERPMR